MSTPGKRLSLGIIAVCLGVAISSFGCRSETAAASVPGSAAAQSSFERWSGDQPIAFPHDKHIRAGMKCMDCHSYAAVSPEAGIPSVKKCATCHAVIAADRPEVKKAMAYANAGRDIPWRRVYGFDSSAHVKFRHDMHIFKGIACSSCHGDMSKVQTARELVHHNMGSCVSCHRQERASTECMTCHY